MDEVLVNFTKKDQSEGQVANVIDTERKSQHGWSFGKSEADRLKSLS